MYAHRLQLRAAIALSWLDAPDTRDADEIWGECYSCGTPSRDEVIAELENLKPEIWVQEEDGCWAWAPTGEAGIVRLCASFDFSVSGFLDAISNSSVRSVFFR